MQDHYWITIRNCLLREIKTHATDAVGDVETITERLILRPPKNAALGDLCTNIVQILGGAQDGNCMMQADLIRANVQMLDCIDTVNLADNGYLNMTLSKAALVSDLILIEEKSCGYGMKGLAAHCAPVDIYEPDTSDDLRSLRQVYNGKYLLKLAQLAQVQAQVSPWQPDELRGYPSAAALAKCGENTIKLSLLGNGSDYTAQFSPVLASEKSYDNPAFCLLYAEARLDHLLKMQREMNEEDAVLLETPDVKSLSQPAAQNLLSHLVQWPMVVRQTLRDQDMYNLVSFLQQVSLLFFRLNDQEKLQSSDYLCENTHKSARLQLLRATKYLLSGGLDLMEIDRAEEFI